MKNATFPSGIWVKIHGCNDLRFWLLQYLDKIIFSSVLERKSTGKAVIGFDIVKAVVIGLRGIQMNLQREAV